MTEKYQPTQDRILVKRLPEDEKTPGGLLIPDTAKEKPMKGEIMEVGPGVRDEKGNVVPLTIKKGEFVLFGKWTGTEVKGPGGEEWVIMKESDVLAIIVTQ